MADNVAYLSFVPFQVLFWTGILVALYLFFMSRRKLPIERGQTPVISLHPGVWWKRGDNIPFAATRGIARVSLYQDILVLVVITKKLVLTRDQIKEVKCKQRLTIITVQVNPDEDEITLTFGLPKKQTACLQKALKDWIAKA